MPRKQKPYHDSKPSLTFVHLSLFLDMPKRAGKLRQRTFVGATGRTPNHQMYVAAPDAQNKVS